MHADYANLIYSFGLKGYKDNIVNCVINYKQSQQLCPLKVHQKVH